MSLLVILIVPQPLKRSPGHAALLVSGANFPIVSIVIRLVLSQNDETMRWGCRCSSGTPLTASSGFKLFLPLSDSSCGRPFSLMNAIAVTLAAHTFTNSHVHANSHLACEG